MRTLQEKYNAILEGNFSKEQFRRDAAMQLPNLVSKVNSFDDTVSILKNRGMISEKKKQEPIYSTAKPEDHIAPDVLDTGIKFELDKKFGTLEVSEEDFNKAKETAIRNLSKDVLYYVKQDSIQLDTPEEQMEKVKVVKEQADHVAPMVVKAYREYLEAKKEGNGEKAYRYYSKKLNNTYSTRADRDAIEAILKKKYGSALEEATKEEDEYYDKLAAERDAKHDKAQDEYEKIDASLEEEGIAGVDTVRHIAKLTNQLLGANPGNKDVKAFAISVKNDLESGDSSRLSKYSSILDLSDLEKLMNKDLNEDHSSNPNDKYVVRPCKNKKEPWAVWEGEVRVKGFKTKEEAQAFADKQNKEQGLNELDSKEALWPLPEEWYSKYYTVDFYADGPRFFSNETGEEVSYKDISAHYEKEAENYSDIVNEDYADESKGEGLAELERILEELEDLERDATSVLKIFFPSYLKKAQAYGALDFGISSNPHDTTLASIVDEIRGDENALKEGGVNEELSLEQKKVERFLKAIAKEFDYSIQDAANFVKSTISKMDLKESLDEGEWTDKGQSAEMNKERLEALKAKKAKMEKEGAPKGAIATVDKQIGELEKLVSEVDNSDYAMRVRAMKNKKPSAPKAPKANPNAGKIAQLNKHRAQIMRDMEQEAEPEGGPIADKYGDMLNKIDKAIAQLQGATVKEANLNMQEVEEYLYGIHDLLGQPTERPAQADIIDAIFEFFKVEQGLERDDVDVRDVEMLEKAYYADFDELVASTPGYSDYEMYENKKKELKEMFKKIITKVIND